MIHRLPCLSPRMPLLRAAVVAGLTLGAAAPSSPALAAPAAAQARPSLPTPPPPARLEARAGGFAAYLLPNGFRIILLPFPAASNARIELLVKTGSKMEGYGETGMAHLLEHMLFKGAGRRASVKDDLTALGATWNGTTTADRTNYYETVPADAAKIDEALRIEADRFLRPRFTRADLASEMTVVRNELENSDRQPGQVLMSALLRNSFHWHGYRRDTIGARSDVETVPFEALQAFHRRHYRPDNAALIVSGNFDGARVLALAVRLFSQARNPRGPRAVNRTFDPPEAATHRSEIRLAAGVTMAASSWKLPGDTHRDAYAFDLGITAICDPDWGSLRQDLVLERKLAVSASCATTTEQDYSRLVASARAAPGVDAEPLSRALVEHIEAAAARGATQSQLDRARLSMQNGLERVFSSHEDTAEFVSAAEVSGDWRLMFWARDLIESVTLEEANAALRKWTIATNRADVLLRDADAAAPLAIPAPLPARPLVEGRRWDDVVKSADPAPRSLAELAQATRRIELDGMRARAALISRRTQGDRVSMVLVNDYGNPVALSGRGIACSFASSLMDLGGAGLSREQLETRMESLQAVWSLDLSGISLQVPPRHLQAAFRLLMSVWASPTLPRDEFDRLRAAALTRIESAMKSPEKVADSALRLRFDNYPQGHPRRPLGLHQRAEALRALTYEDVAQCARDFAALSHVRIGMVGNVSDDDVRGLWTAVAPLPRATIPYERIPDPRAPDSVDTTAITVAMPDKPNAVITATAVIALNENDPEHPALQLAVQALGGGSDSRIWRRLRERAGLSYSAGMAMSGSALDDRLTLQLHATSASEQSQAALQALRSTLEQALRDGLTTQEIARAKRTWALQRKASLGEESRYPSVLAAALLDGQDHGWLAKYDAAIERVTAAQATAALRKYLGNAPIVWAVGRGS